MLRERFFNPFAMLTGDANLWGGRQSMNFEPFVPYKVWNEFHDTSELNFTLPVSRGWTEDALNLRIAMPGVADKDFTLTQQGNRLTVRGERRQPENFGDEGATHYTLPYGRFERIIDLPEGLDLGKMKAALHHGMLDIHIPYRSEVKARTVPVVVTEKKAAKAIA